MPLSPQDNSIVSLATVAQKQRGIDRERIETLLQMYFGARTDVYLKLQALLKRNLNDDVLLEEESEELASLGFLYTPDAFLAELRSFHAARGMAPSDPTADDETSTDDFVSYLLENALKNYVEKSEERHQGLEKDTGHVDLYKKILEGIHLQEQINTNPQSDTLRSKEKELEKSIEAPLKLHTENAQYREIAARAAFMLVNKIKAPEGFIKNVNKDFGYDNWDGKHPLPDVNLKRKNESVAEIRVDNIGVTLEELAKIMNQQEPDISLSNRSCDGQPNPFRNIEFEFGGEIYTLIAKYENGIFEVKPCLKSLMDAGKPEVAVISGWMKGGKLINPKDPASMDVAGAQADALRRLAKFHLESALNSEQAVFHGEVPATGGQRGILGELEDTFPPLDTASQELGSANAGAGLPGGTDPASLNDSNSDNHQQPGASLASAANIPPGNLGTLPYSEGTAIEFSNDQQPKSGSSDLMDMIDPKVSAPQYLPDTGAGPQGSNLGRDANASPIDTLVGAAKNVDLSNLGGPPLVAAGGPIIGTTSQLVGNKSGDNAPGESGRAAQKQGLVVDAAKNAAQSAGNLGESKMVSGPKPIAGKTTEFVGKKSTGGEFEGQGGNVDLEEQQRIINAAKDAAYAASKLQTTSPSHPLATGPGVKAGIATTNVGKAGEAGLDSLSDAEVDETHFGKMKKALEALRLAAEKVELTPSKVPASAEAPAPAPAAAPTSASRTGADAGAITKQDVEDFKEILRLPRDIIERIFRLDYKRDRLGEDARNAEIIISNHISNLTTNQKANLPDKITSNEYDTIIIDFERGDLSVSRKGLLGDAGEIPLDKLSERYKNGYHMSDEKIQEKMVRSSAYIMRFGGNNILRRDYFKAVIAAYRDYKTELQQQLGLESPHPHPHPNE